MALSQSAVMVLPVSKAKGVIARFTTRRTIKGAIIFALLAAAESIAQAVGIVAAYPNEAQRAHIIYGLASNAAFGLFYGDKNADITSPAGYMVYRILPILVLIGAIWGLMTATKMLREQEENGRWEILLAGTTTARKATMQTLCGLGGSLVICYLLSVLIIIAGGHNNKVTLPVGPTLYYGLALLFGAAAFMAVGALTSQLAATRRRAIFYGLVPLIIFFILRSVGNVVTSLAWLKNITPFGWIEKLHPYVNPEPGWLLLLMLFTVVCAVAAIYVAGKRDLNESLIADIGVVQPKRRLLRSQTGFTWRLTRANLVGGLIGSVAFASLIAAIDKTVGKSLSSQTNTLNKSFGKLAGNPKASIELAYLSAAGYFIMIVLLFVVTTAMKAARDEEASSRLDNFLSGTVSRFTWLRARLTVLIGAVVVITLISNFSVWAIATAQGIHVSLVTLLFSGLNILGPVGLLLGIGVLIFGLMPRITTVVMYIIIAWSFTIDLIAAAAKLNKAITDTSLLHYVTLVPAAKPNWTSFAVLLLLGVALSLLGFLAFIRRDLEAE